MNKLQQYNEMLIEKTAVMNLTAHRTLEESWHKNIMDSLLFAREFEKLGAASLLDIGSGAGLPGIPLAIQCPRLQITMLDSVGKKAAFISDAIAKLGLTNAAAVHARIEDYPEREKFDAAACKAVAPLPTLLEYALPFLKTGGCLYAFKGSNYQEEIKQSEKALSVLGAKIERVEQADLDAETVRYLIIVKKTTKTAVFYPRKKNLPRTRPLM